jgi:Na+/H+ antiporter NhaD/arsenite permease-like protein
MGATLVSPTAPRRPAMARDREAAILPPVPELTWIRLVALLAFTGTYVGLAVGHLPGFRVDRTGVAIIGAAAMVVSGVPPWEKAVAAVDAHTLVLLFGMMIVAAYLRLSSSC